MFVASPDSPVVDLFLRDHVHRGTVGSPSQRASNPQQAQAHRLGKVISSGKKPTGSRHAKPNNRKHAPIVVLTWSRNSKNTNGL